MESTNGSSVVDSPTAGGSNDDATWPGTELVTWRMTDPVTTLGEEKQFFRLRIEGL